jgi:hypothetical protein
MRPVDIESSAFLGCLLRAVQSSPFPLFAARRRGGPAGQGVGWGPQGSLPDPAHLGPMCEKSRFPDVMNRCEQQGRERRVTRSIGSGYGYGYGYDGQMSDPQGMPLIGNAPWGWCTTGHAANRHCPLE